MGVSTHYIHNFQFVCWGVMSFYRSTPVNIKAVCLSLCHQVVVRPLRKTGGGRRRQLVFADPQVQISDRAMKEQIGNPLAETLDLVQKHTDLNAVFILLKCFSHLK